MLIKFWGIQGRLLGKESLESTFRMMCVFGECYHLDFGPCRVHCREIAKKFSFCLSATFSDPTKTQTALMKDRMMHLGFSQLHEVDCFSLKCKNKDVNTIKDPLRSVAVAVTAAFVPKTGSEEAGGSRQSVVQSMFLIWFW